MTKIGVLLAGVAVAVAIVFCAGCESEKTTTGITLTVNPASSVINTNGIVLLTAGLPAGEQESRKIYYPLSWSVSNTKIGILRDMAGDSAVYEGRNAKGVNTVTVRDQSGAEGIAAITQQAMQDPGNL